MKLNHLLFFLFVISLCSCHKKDPDGFNICDYEQPVRATFTVTQTCTTCNDWIDYQCDTVSAGKVVFNAVLNNASSYEWHIGSAVYDSQTVNLTYSASNLNIPVTLIVHKTPDNNCFPGDRSVDTLTKDIVINNSTHLYYGQWQGYYIDSNTQQPITTNGPVTVTILTKSTGGYQNVPAIYGMQNTDSIVEPGGYYQSYKELNYEFLWGKNPDTYGRAVVDSTGNNIEIYQHYTGPQPNTSNYITIYTKFRGKRL